MQEFQEKNQNVLDYDANIHYLDNKLNKMGFLESNSILT